MAGASAFLSSEPPLLDPAAASANASLRAHNGRRRAATHSTRTPARWCPVLLPSRGAALVVTQPEPRCRSLCRGMSAGAISRMLWELALSMRSTGGPDSNYPQNVLLQQPSSQAAKQPQARGISHGRAAAATHRGARAIPAGLCGSRRTPHRRSWRPAASPMTRPGRTSAGRHQRRSNRRRRHRTPALSGSTGPAPATCRRSRVPPSSCAWGCPCR